MTVCACLWLGLFPLLQFGTYQTITYNKWTIMLLLVCLTVFCIIGRKPVPEKRKRKELPPPRPPVTIACTLLFWIVFSNLFSPYGFIVWFFGGTYRMEGFLSQLCYLGLFFIFASPWVRISRKPVMISAAAGMLCFLVVVLLQRSGVNALGLYPAGNSYENAPAFQGTIGNIDMDNGYLCLMAALFLPELIAEISALFRELRPKKKPSTAPRQPGTWVRADVQEIKGTVLVRRLLYPLLLLAALLAAVYLVITMDVQFGAITLAFLLLITVLRFVPRARRKWFLLALVVLVLAVVWFWPGQSGGIWELKEILHGRPQLSFGSNRLAVWVYSMRLAPQRLLTGGGSDTFRFRFNEFIRANGLEIPTEQNGVPLPNSFDTPHNEYVAHLINHGLPAVLLFIALIIAAAFFRRRYPKGSKLKPPADRLNVLSPWAIAVLCYAVQAFFSFSVPMVAPMFWVTLGICVGEDTPPEK